MHWKAPAALATVVATAQLATAFETQLVTPLVVRNPLFGGHVAQVLMFDTCRQLVAFGTIQLVLLWRKYLSMQAEQV